MKRILSAILVLILTAGLLISGCSSSSEPEGPQIGNLAPDFQLQNLEGETISLSGLRGKPVFVNFWASWCPPCRDEMPFIQEIFEDKEWQDKGLIILAVNLTYSKSSETPAAVKDFMQSLNLSFPVLLDINKDVSLEYNIRYIPTTFLVDKDGIIQAIKFGAFSSKADIEKSLSKIIP